MSLPVRVDVNTAIDECLVDFRCPRCGFVTQAWATTTGTGLAVSGIWLSRADLDGEVSAARAVQLVPCPRCAHRSRAGIAKVLAVGAVLGLIAAMAAGFAAAESFSGSDGGGQVGMLVGAGTFLAVLVATAVVMLKRARRRVRFGDERALVR